jgi:spoIIIJ-associated protein
METYEFEGKTTEEAIENASRELDLPMEELNIDVIEPGSAGIFGLVGGKRARIKVSVKSVQESKDEDKDEDKDVAGTAQEVLEKILSLIPIEAAIKADRVDDRIILSVVGDRSGLLIGRKGKTLDALQYIVNKIVNKALDMKVDVVIDSEDYRKRREESLAQIARKMGDKAKRMGKPVTTAPMNPHDRRIIHLTIKEDQDLETRSRGEGVMKRVVIIPKHKER